MHIRDSKAKNTIDFDLASNPDKAKRTGIFSTGLELTFFQHMLTQELRFRYWMSPGEVARVIETINYARHTDPMRDQFIHLNAGGDYSIRFKFNFSQQTASIRMMFGETEMIKVDSDFTRAVVVIRHAHQRLQKRLEQ